MSHAPPPAHPLEQSSAAHRAAEHNRESCFFAEEDYHAYLHWLGEALAKERCALHAYGLNFKFKGEYREKHKNNSDDVIDICRDRLRRGQEF